MATFSTNDLRSHAKDHGRVKAYNNKWAHGSRPAPGKSCSHSPHGAGFSACVDCLKRPQRDTTRNFTALRQAETKRELGRHQTMARKVFRSNIAEGVLDAQDDLSDSSGDFEVDHSSAAPELKDVMYSFDAPTGPNRGNDVLSHAISQAVQRFENNETDKIVKNEYDLVLDGKDEPESYVADADDDFELIDGTHLH